MCFQKPNNCFKSTSGQGDRNILQNGPKGPGATRTHSVKYLNRRRQRFNHFLNNLFLTFLEHERNIETAY